MLISFLAFVFGVGLLVKGIYVLWKQDVLFALLFVLTGSLLLVGLFCLPQYDIMGFALPGMLVSMLYNRHTRKCETQCKE